MRKVLGCLLAISVLAAPLALATTPAQAGTVQAASVRLVPPTSLKASASDGKVRLVWSANLTANVTGFRIYRDGARLTKVGRVRAVTVSATNGRRYGYQVAALGRGGTESRRSSQVFATALPAKPLPPSTVKVTAGDRLVRVGWTASTRAVKYRIYRNGVAIKTLDAPLLSWVDLGRTNGVSVTYRVAALDVFGQGSALSSTASATPLPAKPLAPGTVQATAGDQIVQVGWTAAASAVRYQIYRDGEAVHTVEAPLLSWEDLGRTNGLSVIYRVAAQDAFGQVSAQSSAVSATPLPTPPGAPAGLLAQAGDAVVQLSWLASPTAVTYRLFRDGTEIAQTQATTFNDDSVANGTTYQYTVVAVDQYGQTSASSRTVSARPLPGRPKAPDVLSAVPGDGRVQLSWHSIEGAAKYEVRRDGAVVATVLAPQNAFSDEFVENGTTYEYTVLALDQYGQVSDPSGTATAMPLPVHAVVNVAVVPVSRTSAVVSWSPVSGATGYKVQRALASNLVYATVGTVSTPSFEDTSLAGDTIYSYRVVATNEQDEAPVSAAVQVYTTVLPTPTLSMVSAASVRGSAFVGSVGGYRSVEIERATIPTGPFTKVFEYTVSPNVTGASWTDTTVATNTIYYYRVLLRSTTDGWVTLPSAATAGVLTLSAAWNVAVVPLSRTSAALSWLPVTAATGYKVQRAAMASPLVYSTVATVSTTSFEDTSLAADTIYSYRVVATNEQGDAPVSAVVQVYTTVPATPTLSAVSATSVKVSFVLAADNGARVLEIQRATSPTGPFYQVFGFSWGNSDSTSASWTHNNTTVAPNTTYYYRVVVSSLDYKWVTLPSEAASITTPAA